jgi:iron only hydrogenase large subunit-like protein
VKPVTVEKKPGKVRITIKPLCKPLVKLFLFQGVASIKIGPDGTYSQVDEEGSEVVLEKATISLSDCLACSGCVTSAESVLISQQSQEELYRVAGENKKLEQEGRGGEGKVIVVSISPQVRASIAAKFNLTVQEVHTSCYIHESVWTLHITRDHRLA